MATQPTSPPEITELPEYPQRLQAKPNYNQLADGWAAAMPVFSGDIATLSDNLFDNATVSYNNATVAESSAASASSDAAAASVSAQTAQSVANSNGSWSNLTGALSIPASVAHNGQSWELLNNLTDVTLSEPGVTTDWQLINDINMSNVRVNKLNSPLVSLFKPNKVVETLNGQLTRRRESGATYIDRYGVLRYSPSPSATNLCLYSDDFTQSNWVSVNVDGLQDDTHAPDGTTFAANIRRNSAGLSSLSTTISADAEEFYTVSIWLKNPLNNGDSFVMRIRESGGVTTDTDKTITAHSEYERYQLTIKTQAGTNSIEFFPFLDSSGNTDANLHIFGAQIEKSKVANGYVKTGAIPASGSSYLGIDTLREEAEGYLIEGASTNLAYPSIVPASTSGNILIGSGITSVTADAEIAPDSTMTATRIIGGGSNQNSGSGSSIRINHSLLPIGTYTVSYWAKSISGTMSNSVRFVGGTTDSTVTAVEVNGGQRTSVDDKWGRYSSTFEITTPETSINMILVFGVGSETFDLWGVQVERQESVTSYIPSASSSATTRAVDDVFIASSDNLSTKSGTILTSFAVNNIGSSNQYLFNASDGTSSNRIASLITSSLRHIIVDNSISQFDSLSASIPSINVSNQSAITYSQNSFNAYLNSEKTGSDSSGTVPTQLTKISIGSSSSSLPLGGHLSSFLIYDFILNHDEIKYLSGQ